MPPDRSSLTHNPCIGSKPYARKVYAQNSSQPKPLGESRAANIDASKSLRPSTCSSTTAPLASSLRGLFCSAESRDWPGFPTRAQYAQIESAYLGRLASIRREKALISQALFHRICDVLQSPENTNEKAPFRYWARKMFTMGKADVISPVLSLGPGHNPGSMSAHKLGADSDAFEVVEREVLLHDGLLVVVKEQIYDLLCFCHGSTNHAGRDKTRARVRKNYTWVPKDLIVQFIKACPTCVRKRLGYTDNETSTTSTPAIASNSTSCPRPTSEKEIFPKGWLDLSLPTSCKFFSDFKTQRKTGDEPSPNSYSISPNNSPIDTSPLDDSIKIPRDASQFDASLTLLGLSCVDVPTTSRNPKPLSPTNTSLYRGVQYGPLHVTETDYTHGYATPPVSQRIASVFAYDRALGKSNIRVRGAGSLIGVDLGANLDERLEELPLCTAASSTFADGLSTSSPQATPNPVPLQWLDEEMAMFRSPLQSNNGLPQLSMPMQSTDPEGAAANRYESPSIFRCCKSSIRPFLTPGKGSTISPSSDFEGLYEPNFPAYVDVKNRRQGAREADPSRDTFEMTVAMGQSPASESSAGATRSEIPVTPVQSAAVPLGGERKKRRV